MLLNTNSNSSQKYWILIQNDKLLLPNKNELYFTDINIIGKREHIISTFSISIENNIEYVVAELKKDLDLKNKYTALTLRQAIPHIDINQLSIVFKAFSIIHWDKSHQYCGYCGKNTNTQKNRFEKICAVCQVSFYPRISPSIIVLIHNDDKLIMARSHHFASGVYGLIAGFVEVGETIEEAVHREVKEEIGIQIKNVTYKYSQPWPFPDTLMLGFTAEYASGEIIIDKTEIEDAGWYSYNNLPGRPSTSRSISSKLLEEFVKNCNDKYGKNINLLR